MSNSKILINQFHPNLDRSLGNKTLLDAVRDLSNVTIRNMYAEYPDFKIDFKREQALLEDHDVIVIQHPFQWYSCPALLKEWEDRVLQFGWAYPAGRGDKLKGKKWQTVITTGGPAEAYQESGYNNFTISELLRPFQQTATLCQMEWQPPFAVHAVMPAYKGISEEELNKRAADYRALLEAFGE